MSYTDIVCVFSFADSDAHDLAQGWLDAMADWCPATTRCPVSE